MPELGEPFHGSGRHPDSVRRLFEAVAQLVKLVTDRQPLVLILEDMHWADELSVRLLSFLARRIAEWPVLIVVTARQEEVDAGSALQRALAELSSTGVLVERPLRPLTRSDTASLVHELVRLDGTRIEAEQGLTEIWAVSQGNPFMIVEAVHALAEGATVSTGGTLPFTPAVREMVASRLARLTERARRVITVAAVIGRAFEFTVLQRASGFGEIEAAEAVGDLIRRRLVRAVSHEFEVIHDWVREVAYAELPAPLRRVLHAAAGRAIEKQYAGNLGPHYPALARHYVEGEVWDKAVVYLHAAGSGAAARLGHLEAVARFGAALEVLSRLPETRDVLERGIDLRLDLHRSLSWLGAFEPLIDHLRDAEPLARRLGDQRRLGWVLVSLGFCTRMTGRPVDAYHLGRGASAIAEEVADVDLQIEADFELGMAHLFTGDHLSAQALFQRAFQTGSERLDRLPGRAVAALSYLGRSRADCGHFEEAAAHGREAIRLAEQLDSPINLVVAHSELSNVHETRGEFDRAVPILERGLAIARERELTLLTPGMMGSLFCAYAMAGRPRDSLALLDEMQRADTPARMRTSQSNVIVKLAQGCLAVGRLEDARTFAARALALTSERGLRGWEASALRVMGEIASRRRPADLGEAEACYRAALARAQELGLRPLEARCHLGLAMLSRPGTPEHLAAARAMFAELGMQPWLDRATPASSVAP